MKKLAAIVLAMAAALSALSAYAGKPDAATCQSINQMNRSAGLAATSCGASAGLLWLAAAFAVGSVIMLVVARATSHDARVRREAARMQVRADAAKTTEEGRP